MNSQEIFGAEIQYFRLDPVYWEKIIKQFKDTGLKCVASYVPWSTHLIGLPDKKHPAGVLDFEGKTNPSLNLLKFLELIEKYELNLNFRCGPFVCNEMVYGGYPQWIVMGNPDMMVWDYQNRPAPGYWIAKKEGSQPSYLHPEYLEWCRRWFDVVDKIIVKHLKSTGGCITMVNLDNEVSYIVQDGFLSSDYNPVNVAPGGYYHKFLAEKYKKASNLPYSKKYTCIEDVEPPRCIPDDLKEDIAYYLDWCEFKEWVMCKYLSTLREFHQENGVNDIIFMTNLNPHLPEGIPTRMPSFEKAVDGIVGYDFYRGTFMSYSGYHSMARILKLMNSSLKYTYSAEFMSGTWKKVLPTRVSSDHMRFMARCALSHGCKAISWFMFHDRDCWGDAPVSSHGHPRESLFVLKEIPGVVFKKIKNWDALKPQYDVGIIYDLIQHKHTYIGDPLPCNENNLYEGKPFICNIPAGKVSKEYIGLFRIIEECGYQADAIDIVHSTKGLKKYPLLFLPGAPLIERCVIKVLEDYVKGGGVLVLSGSFPEIDEKGHPVKFFGMGRNKKMEGVDKIKYGDGKVIILGYIAQDECEEEDIKSINLVRNILKKYVGEPFVKIDISRPVEWIDWKKEGGGHTIYKQPRNLGSAIIHKNNEETILFVLNHYPEAVNFIIQLKDRQYKKLINLDTDEIIYLKNGKAILDIDRKSAAIYLVI
ncbi:MAG: beta-galactosidase [Candidatus Omnitrophica bacterium]|nr:beta-galactosidase [Candidatus Omnitrophota bacterium]